MPNQSKIDEICMKNAEEWRKLSKCNRNKVACVIYNPSNNTIISVGYNGTPSCFPNECEGEHENVVTTPQEYTHWWVLHAEANAIVKMAKDKGASTKDTWLYTTCSPCKECSKLIVQAEIKRVIYKELYRDDPEKAMPGIYLMQDAGIDVTQME